jgi:hypothetical protein
MDSFSRTKLCPSRCYLTFFHIPERSIALVNDWLVHQKELKLIPTCPTLTKVLLQGSTRILIYIDGLLSVAPTPSRCYLTFFHSERSIALVKRLAGSPGAEIDPNLPHANKVLLQGSTRILIYIDGLLSVAPNCAQAVAILPSSIFPNVQLH